MSRAIKSAEGEPRPPGLVGVSDVARILGLSRNTVWQYNSRGTLPAPDYRIEGVPIWKQSKIERWKETR